MSNSKIQKILGAEGIPLVGYLYLHANSLQGKRINWKIGTKNERTPLCHAANKDKIDGRTESYFKKCVLKIFL